MNRLAKIAERAKVEAADSRVIGGTWTRRAARLRREAEEREAIREFCNGEANFL